MTDTTLSHAAPRAAREQAREGFRQAMSWLHTWAGLVLGWLLFAIFLTGTLSFFKTELNLWMRPELHGMPPATADVAERAVAAMNRKVPDVTQWILRMPDERQNAVTLLWRDTGNGRFETLLMNPQTGETVDARKTMGGEFFYRFHFELRTAQKGRWAIEGRWVVGVATMLMFIALLTGVVTHRRIFKDFFTFRPAKGGQRAWLDAHNVTGVLVLPFYLMITFSGLMIFHTLYMPSGIAVAYQGPKGVDSQTYFADLQGEKPERRVRRNPGDKVEPLPAAMPLAVILKTARERWDGGRIGGIQARRDAQGTPVVEVTRHEGDRLQYRPERMLFNGTTGALLEQTDATTPAAVTYGVLYGLHLGRFAGPGMRWVLVGFGLLGSLMIATGMVLWSVKRSAQGQRKGAAADAPVRLPFGQRLVASLNIASLAGLPLACAVYMASNRLIPLDAPERPDAELSYFFGAWGVALLWGVLFPNRRGWSLVLALAGAAWAALPLLNALSTSTHLGVSLPAGDWLWAGMDLTFLATGVLLGWLAWRLRPGRPLPGKAPRRAAATPAMAEPDAQPAAPA
ncbi:MAG: PepSY-associated TM helix domain-containing protein [Pseudomonadota bacterium]